MWGENERPKENWVLKKKSEEARTIKGKKWLAMSKKKVPG